MYSREQAAQIRKSFWIRFGQYMKPVPAADGGKVNWLNYKTGYKGFNFRMDVDKNEAFIGIVMTHKDADLRTLFYEQLLEMRSVLHSLLEEEWIWEEKAINDNYQEISRAYTLLPGVSIFKEEDWPAIISFLKNRVVALDEFWSLGKYHFEPLKFWAY